jgi:hypothetical protein
MLSNLQVKLDQQYFQRICQAEDGLPKHEEQDVDWLYDQMASNSAEEEVNPTADACKSLPTCHEAMEYQQGISIIPEQTVKACGIY